MQIANTLPEQTPPIRIPGTYRPQEDTALLIRTMLERDLARGRRVLDVCTGTGALALAAAAAGASSVTAVDLSWRAVANTRINARLRRARVEVLQGDLLEPVEGRSFDLVIANPPYVPAPAARLPRHRIGRCWDGGVDGRLLVDRICDGIGATLTPGGRFLITHSSLIGADITVRRLRARGLRTLTVASVEIPFGPVMTARAGLFAERGLIEPDQTSEQLVVIEAVRPRHTEPVVVDLPRPCEQVPERLAG